MSSECRAKTDKIQSGVVPSEHCEEVPDLRGNLIGPFPYLVVPDGEDNEATIFQSFESDAICLGVKPGAVVSAAENLNDTVARLIEKIDATDHGLVTKRDLPPWQWNSIPFQNPLEAGFIPTLWWYVAGAPLFENCSHGADPVATTRRNTIEKILEYLPIEEAHREPRVHGTLNLRRVLMSRELKHGQSWR